MGDGGEREGSWALAGGSKVEVEVVEVVLAIGAAIGHEDGYGAAVAGVLGEAGGVGLPVAALGVVEAYGVVDAETEGGVVVGDGYGDVGVGVGDVGGAGVEVEGELEGVDVDPVVEGREEEVEEASEGGDAAVEHLVVGAGDPGGGVGDVLALSPAGVEGC